jgi:hypothetical protein
MGNRIQLRITNYGSGILFPDGFFCRQVFIIILFNSKPDGRKSRQEFDALTSENRMPLGIAAYQHV